MLGSHAALVRSINRFYDVLVSTGSPVPFSSNDVVLCNLSYDHLTYIGEGARLKQIGT